MGNTGKIFAIGDIHGCYEKLIALMNKAEVDLNNDTLIFLGDYIDRGEKSFEVVEHLIGLKKRYANIILLKGNHEEMFMEYLSGDDTYAFLMNGGLPTVESYMKQNFFIDDITIPEEHLKFFNSLDLYFETDNYLFVHAGFREGVLIEDQKPEDMLWIREDFTKSDFDFGKQVVFGHTPLPEPLIMPNKIGIDTGAVYDNKLTCLELPAMKFFYV